MKHSIIFAGSNAYILEYLAQRSDINILHGIFHKNSGDFSKFIAICRKYSLKHNIITSNKQILGITKVIDTPVLGISAGFEILSKEVCAWPKKGFINIHPSYLPFYKGANPYYHMLINNEKQGGVSIHQVTQDIDGGKIFCRSKYPILLQDDISDLIQKSNRLAKMLLDKYLIKIIDDKLKPIRNSKGTKFPPVKTRQWADLTMPPQRIYNLVRSQTIYGGCYIILNNRRVLVKKAVLIKRAGKCKCSFGRGRLCLAFDNRYNMLLTIERMDNGIR